MGKVSWWRTIGATATWTEKMLSASKLVIKSFQKKTFRCFLMIDTDKLRLIIGIYSIPQTTDSNKVVISLFICR